MHARRFLSSFALTLLLVSPLLLNARSPVRAVQRVQAAPLMMMPMATVDGVPFNTKIIERGAGYANLAVTAHNTTAEPVVATFRVAIAEQPGMEMISRVPVMPTTVAFRDIKVELGPGEKFEQRVSLLNSKIKAPAKPKAGANADKAALAGLLNGAQPARVFATIAHLNAKPNQLANFRGVK